jgi:hypothetical protein
MMNVYFMGAMAVSVPDTPISIDPSSVPLGTSGILFAVNQGGINWLPNGQDPTPTFGLPLYAGQMESLEHGEIPTLRFVRSMGAEALMTVMFVAGINIR